LGNQKVTELQYTLESAWWGSSLTCRSGFIASLQG
jgi:hypothetical protein